MQKVHTTRTYTYTYTGRIARAAGGRGPGPGPGACLARLCSRAGPGMLYTHVQLPVNEFLKGGDPVGWIHLAKVIY